MKKLLSVLLLLCLLLSSCAPLYPTPQAENTADAEPTEEPPMIGMWLSQFDLTALCVDQGTQRNEREFLALLQQMMDRIKDLGINTVFVQARPNGDSMYPSKLYPSSPYATGSIDSPWSYDPFAHIVREARSRALSVHGWINPFRCFTDKNKKEISADHPIMALSPYMRPVDGVWYLDPSSPEAREYIARGAEELLLRYSLDGIHIDDYFYPTTDESFDKEAYEACTEQNPSTSLADFRRDSVSALVSLLYHRVHRISPTARFGVSPSGNKERNQAVLYADVERWCAEEGYVDYILPQIYFGEEHETLPFTKTCREFADSVTSDTVSLYVGVTLEKAYRGSLGQEDVYAGAGADEWITSQTVLRRCIESLTRIDCRGVCFFSYRLFFDPLSGEPIAETAREIEGIREALVRWK